MRRRGFTLIELLVVIAIIAILAAILFPVFSAARASGYRTKCMANLRAIGRAMDMYRDANNGRNVSIWQQRSWYGQNQNSWHFAILPYIGQNLQRESGDMNKEGEGNARQSVFRCPSAPWQKMTTAVKDPNNPSQKVEPFSGASYHMNEVGWWDIPHGRISPACEGGYSGVGVLDSYFRRPKETIVIAESMGVTAHLGIGYSNGDKVWNDADPIVCDDSGTENPLPEDIIPLCDPNKIGLHGGSESKIYNIRVSHDGRSMLLFYDGHIECRRTTKGRNWSIYY